MCLGCSRAGLLWMPAAAAPTLSAVVVLKAAAAATEAGLQEFVKGRLRSARTPEEIAFWEELPYNETGKLLRRRVRSELMAG